MGGGGVGLGVGAGVGVGEGEGIGVGVGEGEGLGVGVGVGAGVGPGVGVGEGVGLGLAEGVGVGVGAGVGEGEGVGMGVGVGLGVGEGGGVGVGDGVGEGVGAGATTASFVKPAWSGSAELPLSSVQPATLAQSKAAELCTLWMTADCEEAKLDQLKRVTKRSPSASSRVMLKAFGGAVVTHPVRLREKVAGLPNLLKSAAEKFSG